MKKAILFSICLIIIFAFFINNTRPKTKRNTILLQCSEDINKEDFEKFLIGETETVQVPEKSKFTLGFNGEISLEKIVIKFQADKIPANIEIYSTDYMGAINYDDLYEVKDNTKNNLVVDVGNKYKCAYVSFEILDDKGEFALSDISIYGKPTYPECLEGESEIVLEAKDGKNPLNVWIQPIRKNIYTLADEILKGKNGLTPHEKIVLFMEYMKDYKIGSNLASPENIFKDKIGECGNFSNALVALATTQNMEARIITMGNYPINDGHVVAEIKVNNKWCVYDPTYAAYYTITPEDAKNPYVLSFEELRAGRAKDKGVTRVVGFQERLTSEIAYEFLGPDIYELANPAGPIGVSKKMFYPLNIDYKRDREITKEEYGAGYQGASYIGAAGINSSHSWSISNLEPNKEYTFKILGSYVGGDLMEGNSPNPDFNAYASIENGLIIDGSKFTFNMDNGNKEWVIKFKPEDSTAKITLSHDYVGPDFHYVQLDKFSIE